MPYEGPYEIIKKNSDLNYLVQVNSKGQTEVTYFDKLKLFNGRIPSWITGIFRELKN